MKHVALGAMSTLATIAGMKAEGTASTGPQQDSTADLRTEVRARDTSLVIDAETISFEDATALARSDSDYNGLGSLYPVGGGIGITTGALLNNANANRTALNLKTSWAGPLGVARGTIGTSVGQDGLQFEEAEARLALLLGVGYEYNDGLHTVDAGIGIGRQLPYFGVGGAFGSKAHGFHAEYLQAFTRGEHGYHNMAAQLNIAMDILKNKDLQPGEDNWGVLLRAALEMDVRVFNHVNIYGGISTGFNLGDVGIKPSTSFEVGVRYSFETDFDVGFGS